MDFVEIGLRRRELCGDGQRDPPPNPCEELRERLLAMREALIAGLAASPVIEAGHLALLGHVGAALAALVAVPAAGLCDTSSKGASGVF
jgi:hypothetical protein